MTAIIVKRLFIEVKEPVAVEWTDYDPFDPAGRTDSTYREYFDHVLVEVSVGGDLTAYAAYPNGQIVDSNPVELPESVSRELQERYVVSVHQRANPV